MLATENTPEVKITGGWASHTQEVAEQQLADNQGKARFPGLYQGNTRIDADLVEGQYGLVWKLSRSAATLFHGCAWMPYDDSHWTPSEWDRPGDPSRSRKQNSFGLIQRWEIAPGRVERRSSSSNFAVWYVITRAG